MKKFQKYSKEGLLCNANAVYDAFVDDDFYYMNFYEAYWFEKELQGLKKIEGKKYGPEICLVKPDILQIVIKWYGTNLNHLFFEKNYIPIDWREQINEILRDLESEEIYKINIYPHTFYTKDNQFKILDLYGCADPLHEIYLEKIINDNDRFKFTKGVLDFKFTYNYTIEHQSNYWPEVFIHA